MLRFDRSKMPVPGFSLDKRDLAHKRTLKRREWRLLLTLPVALVLMAVFIHILNGYRHLIPHGPLEPVIIERVLAPTPPVRLADAAPLPDAAAVEAERSTVRDLIADQANIRHDDTLDALTLAWAQELLAADTARPPIPQRVLARDLVLNALADYAASPDSEGPEADAERAT